MKASFISHRVTPEGLYITSHIGAWPGHKEIETFVPRDEAEMFGWIDPIEEETAPEPIHEEGTNPAGDEIELSYDPSGDPPYNCRVIASLVGYDSVTFFMPSPDVAISLYNGLMNVKSVEAD